MSASSSRRPRVRMDPEVRRAAIRQAAADAFASAPYDSVSLATVAAAAGASEALVHKYFETKAGLYADVLGSLVEDLVSRQQEAEAQLGPAASARDRIRTSLLVYLDFVAAHPAGWAANLGQAGHDAQPAVQLRRRTREDSVDTLRRTVGGSRGARDEYALWGYFGFLDAACLRWVGQGCPEDQRWSLVDAALGCLEGALGDWRR